MNKAKEHYQWYVLLINHINNHGILDRDVLYDNDFIELDHSLLWAEFDLIINICDEEHGLDFGFIYGCKSS